MPSSFLEFFQSEALRRQEDEEEQKRKEVQDKLLAVADKPADLESGRFVDPKSERTQTTVDALMAEISRIAQNSNRDPAIVVEEQLKDEKMATTLLRDFLNGFGSATTNSPFSTTREQLFKRAVLAQELDNKKIGSLTGMIESFVQADENLVSARVEDRKTTVGAFESTQTALIDLTKQTREQRFTAEKDEFDTQASRDLENLKQTGREDIEKLKLNNAEKLEKAKFDNKVKELEHKQKLQEKLGGRESVATSIHKGKFAVPGGHFDTATSFSSSLTGSAVGRAAYISYTPSKESIDAGRAQGEIRESYSRLSTMVDGVGDNGIIAIKEKVNTAVQALRAVAPEEYERVLNEHLAGTLDPNERAVVQQMAETTLKKVLAMSGKQVSNEERKYVGESLPTLLSTPATFRIGLEMERIAAAWFEFKATDQTPSGEFHPQTGIALFNAWEVSPEGNIGYKDRSKLLANIQQIATNMAGGKENSPEKTREAIKWLRSIDVAFLLSDGEGIFE
jgi:hypothetical protein